MKITKQLIPDLEKTLNDIEYRVKEYKIPVARQQGRRNNKGTW